jgi:hypothetical protein
MSYRAGWKGAGALGVVVLGALAALWTAGAGQAAAPPAAPVPAPSADVAGPSPDGIALASAHAAAVREPSRADAWGGARSGNEATLSDRVVHYDIEARLDPDQHTVAGREHLTWRNRSAVNVRSVYLHLYLNAFEGNDSTFFSEARNLGFEFRSEVPIRDGDWGHLELRQVAQGGTAVPWHFVHPDGGAASDHTVVRLDLPAAVAPGASTQLDIDFLDQLPRVVARTGYFGTFHLVGQWFPKIGVLELPGERGARQVQWNVHEFHLHSEFYADYGSFDVRIAVPDGYTVGAVGEEQGAPVQAGGLTTHRFVQDDVHDFAWTADRRSAPVLEGEYRGEGSPIVKVRVLYPPEYAASAGPALKATIDSLAYFSRTLGPYPYRTVTVVVPPYNAGEAGGMEYPTFFTAEGYDEVVPGTLNESLEDFVTIHEFGHGYFYGILGSNEFEEPMLDEGLNEYWDQRMMRERNEHFNLATPWTKRLGPYPSPSGFELDRSNAMRSDPADGLGGNSWDRLNSTSYGTVYWRTTTTLHDLEEALGRPVMEQGFREYYRRWKFRHPSIADLRETLAEVSGRRELVESVFERQVYATEKVDDGIESFTSTEELPHPGTAAAAGAWTETTEKQVDEQVATARKTWTQAHPDAKEGNGGPFLYRTKLTLRRRGAPVAQDVVVKFADGSSETVHWDGPQRWQRYVWVKPAKAVSAEIDPDGHNFLDANVLDDGRLIESDASATRRITGVAAMLEQALLSLAGTL